MARKQREQISIRQDLEAAPFLLPFMAVFVVFIGYPLFYSLFISLYRVTIYSDFYDLFGTMEFVGIGNYVRIFQDPVFLWSIFLTMVYAVLMFATGFAMSLALSLLLHR
jgi:multiple sugar transport system permease protein